MSSMKKQTWIGIVGLGALFMATSVDAQQGADAEMSFRKGSQLTAQEQIAQADKYMASMKDVEAKIEAIVQKARSEKDIIKLNCANDKLTQVKGLRNLADQAYRSLKRPGIGEDQRNHEFAKLTIAYQKITVLHQEAEACIGEEISFVGTTQVDVDVDKDIPAEDPTEVPPPLGIVDIIVRPPLASPFL